MTTALLRAGKSFIHWYWNRVKEVPVVEGSFTAGGIYVAALMTFPKLLQAAVRLL